MDAALPARGGKLQAFQPEMNDGIPFNLFFNDQLVAYDKHWLKLVPKTKTAMQQYPFILRDSMLVAGLDFGSAVMALRDGPQVHSITSGFQLQSSYQIINGVPEKVRHESFRITLVKDKSVRHSSMIGFQFDNQRYLSLYRSTFGTASELITPFAAVRAPIDIEQLSVPVSFYLECKWGSIFTVAADTLVSGQEELYESSVRRSLWRYDPTSKHLSLCGSDRVLTYNPGMLEASSVSLAHPKKDAALQRFSIHGGTYNCVISIQNAETGMLLHLDVDAKNPGIVMLWPSKGEFVPPQQQMILRDLRVHMDSHPRESSRFA